MRTWKLTVVSVLFFGLIFGPFSAQAQQIEREPVTLSVVVVNPSADQTQVIPVRIDLPTEVTPRDILEDGGLELEFDDERSAYYMHAEAVALEPKETRVFEVRVNDVWYVPGEELNGLRNYTGLLLSRIEGTEYYETASDLAQSIYVRLDDIEAVQNDDGLNRKTRIGAYRTHLELIEEIKEDLARMEKLLTFVGGPPVPEMLDNPDLKSDAPSEQTTWLIIFLIVIFIGLLGGTFFFTWVRRSRPSQDMQIMRESTYGGGDKK